MSRPKNLCPSEERTLDIDLFHQNISAFVTDIDLGTLYDDENSLRSRIIAAEEGRDQAETGIQHAVAKRDNLHFRRKQRSHIFRAPHKSQVLATSIINLLDSFSTISDILKGIDQRAGGIAYGTLYILLKVGYNKQRHEDLITKGLDDFSVRLKQIHEYQTAHLREERMLMYINKVHESIVVFARKASIYYSRSGIWRSWKFGIVNHPKIGVESQIEEVQTAINRVVNEANAIMSRRIDNCERNIAYTHNDSLATLRQTLRLTDLTASASSTIKACGIVYPDGIFTQVSRRGRIILLQEADNALLSATGLLGQFQSPAQSSLFLVTGTNHHSLVSTHGLCWLSPFTLEFAKQAAGPLAFFSTQSNGHIDSVSKRVSISTILNAIIYQLLTWNDDLARKYCGTIHRAARAESWQTESSSRQKGLLLEILNALTEHPNVNNPTTIIIDRLDAVCIYPTDGGKCESPNGDELIEFVESLLEILEEAEGVVKVVVTMHAAFSDENDPGVKYNWEHLEKKWRPPLLVSKRGWEQYARKDGSAG